MNRCKHLGPKTGTAERPGRKILVSLHQCDLFDTSCTMARVPIAGVTSCGTCQHNDASKKPRLWGDKIQAALSAIGVTKDAVEKWIGGSCGCDKRRKRVNRLHAWALSLATKAADAAREELDRMLSGKKPKPPSEQ